MGNKKLVKKAGVVLVPQEIIEKKIFFIRGKKVMLDRDLAEMYGVDTRQLTRQVRRNVSRFPDDFMFYLSLDEIKDLKCHFGTSSWGGTRKPAMVFTEQGVAMLSSVLNSERAVQVNIAIMRVFVRIKEIVTKHKELAQRLEQLEQRMERKDEEVQAIFQAIRDLMAPSPAKRKPRIGFHQ